VLATNEKHIKNKTFLGNNALNYWQALFLFALKISFINTLMRTVYCMKAFSCRLA
jgi:hypothetical protein